MNEFYFVCLPLSSTQGKPRQGKTRQGKARQGGFLLQDQGHSNNLEVKHRTLFFFDSKLNGKRESVLFC